MNLGLYSFFEDKWYNFLDLLNKFLPVYKIIDPIDKVFPTFLIAIVLLLITIFAGFYLLFYAESSIQKYEFELIVTDFDGKAIFGAEISFIDECAGEIKKSLVKTDLMGKATYLACSKEIEFSVTKTGYNSFTDSVISSEENIKTVRLSEKTKTQRKVKVLVEDEHGNLIKRAQLFFECIILGKSSKRQVETKLENNEQPPSGFLVDINSTCDSFKIEAVAPQFESKTISLLGNENEKIISLKKISLTRSVIFIANSPIGVQGGAEITLMNSLGEKQKFFTLGNGQVVVELEDGAYSYSAVLNGFIEAGSFEVNSERTTEVEIFFSKLTKPIDDFFIEERAENIYLKLMDRNSPIIASSARIFYKSGNDLNFWRELTANITGTIGPSPVIDANNRVFFAVLRAHGYENKIVQINLKKANDSPQEIEMTKGGAELRIRAIDDINLPLGSAVISIFKSDFNAEIEDAKRTDSNGSVSFKNLAPGKYRIVAKTVVDYGEIEVDMNGVDKEITIQLALRTGTMTFNVLNNGTKASVAYSIQELRSNSFETIISSYSSSGRIVTPKIKAGAIVRLLINDENFLPYESAPFMIRRDFQETHLYLNNEQDLPNNDAVQLRLRKIYETNPFESSERTATRMVGGKTYYFLFDFISKISIQDGIDLPVLANFFVEDESRDTNGFFIMGAKSVYYSSYLMSKVPSGFEINPESNQNLTDKNAKKLNLIVSNFSSPKSFPILLKVFVDQNASGKYELYWQARVGDKNSLLIKKEFEIGKAFCFEDCPVFIFSNYLKQGSSDWVPLTSQLKRLYIGNDYSLKVVAQNLSEYDFGQGVLKLSVDPLSRQKILFQGDKNFFESNATLPPLSQSSPVIASIIPKFETGASKIIESVDVANFGNRVDPRKNRGEIFFELRNKSNLEIEFYATGVKNVLFEKTFYPFFYVRTVSVDPVTRAKHNVPAFWEAKILGQQSQLKAGLTDSNGEQLTSMDLSSIPAGTKIIFTANDENSSNQANLVVEVTKPFAEPIPVVEECIKVNISGVDSNSIQNPMLRVDLKDLATIQIDSNCDEEKRIYVETELEVLGEGPSFLVPPKLRRTVFFNAKETVKANGGVLGVYPVNIYLISGGRTNKISSFDVFVSDSNNPFELSKAIFDFQSKKTIGASITNKQFSGRKDVFEPKVSITGNVGLSYTKQGVPEKINFKLIVDTVAVEGITFGYIFGESVSRIYNPRLDVDCSQSKVSYSLPSEIYFYQEGFKKCQDLIQKISEARQNHINRVSQDNLARDPTKPFASLPTEVQQEILTAQSNKKLFFLKEVEGYDEPAPKASFALLNTTPKGNPARPLKGDIYETYPNPINVSQTDPCSSSFDFHWIDSPELEGFNYQNWFSFMEDGLGRAYVEQVSGYPKILKLGYYGEGLIEGVVSTQNLRTGSPNYSYSGGEIKIQHELVRIVTNANEKKITWEKDVEIEPVEGKIYLLGNYERDLKPSWLNVTKMYGKRPNEEWVNGTVRTKVLCVYPHGFMPFEILEKKGVIYDAPDGNLPFVEYSTDSLKYSKIRAGTIPKGVRVFLNNGKVYAEYIGTTDSIQNPGQVGGLIDFNLSGVGISGISYETITVGDWVGGDSKKEQKFRIKLIGGNVNCSNEDGLEGISGPEFDSRFLFDWKWQNISYNQCDSQNNSYTYCDGTQFLISLFKKLERIDSAIRNNNQKDLPSLTSFYSYLIRDNYSQGFLDDFDEYYSSELFSSNSFNTVLSSTGFDKLITGNKVKFFVRNQDELVEGGALPKGGIYKINIEVNLINEGTKSLIASGEANAEIKVIFEFYQEPKNKNPFYELPFDGEVGKKGGVLMRNGYGVGITGEELKINSQYNLESFENPLKGLNYIVSKNLNQLDDGIVLRLNRSESIIQSYYSQPTPVLMTIRGNVGKVVAQYTLEGTGKDSGLKKKWRLVSSSFGNGCEDFYGMRGNEFEEKILENNNRGIIWVESKRSGRVSLGTVFLTPKSSPTETTRIKPVDSSIVEFDTIANSRIKTGTAIILKYYDDASLDQYDSIKGLFDMISERKLCITNNSSNEAYVWWNPAYLDSLMNQIQTEDQKCNR